MTRRAPYTKVHKRGQVRPPHVKGQGDAVYRRFQCLAPECTETLVIKDVDCKEGFNFECPRCGYVHYDGGSVAVFDYDVVERDSGTAISSGTFSPTHAAHIEAAERVKYCIVCYALHPLSAFDQHASRASGRQGECRACKQLYNAIKNPTRLPEQHREAADTRRLFRELSGDTTIGDITGLLDRFEHRCFNCGRELLDQPGGDDGYYLDHTLPVAWLWPLDTGATVLCRACNGQKSQRWPGEFYEDPARLRQLATRTGIGFEVLSGEPYFNPQAVARLQTNADVVIERWVAYPDKLRAVRERIRSSEGSTSSRTLRRQHVGR